MSGQGAVSCLPQAGVLERRSRDDAAGSMGAWQDHLALLRPALADFNAGWACCSPPRGSHVMCAATPQQTTRTCSCTTNLHAPTNPVPVCRNPAPRCRACRQSLMEAKSVDADVIFRVFTACPEDFKTLIVDVRPYKEFKKKHVNQVRRGGGAVGQGPALLGRLRTRWTWHWIVVAQGRRSGSTGVAF